MVPPSALDRFSAQFAWGQPAVRGERWALHIALLLLTLFTTTVVGAGLSRSFYAKVPVSLDQDFAVLLQVPSSPKVLLEGLPFSLTLITILLAHELGHYVTCLRYGIDASLPYFLPAPTLIGTLGAFIRIRSPIYTRRALFDIGISGPIAGFVALAPALVAGLVYSDSFPGVANRGDLVFGTPLALRLLEWVFFHGVPITDINLHPVARAAWVGLLATALNLLPIGQLDGGHILYAFFGERHKLLSRIFVAALVPIGIFFSWSWLVWAVLLAVFGLRHPVIFDLSELGATRTRLGWLALVLFLLSFTLAPLRSGS
ncbi:MAG: site-2 protease family protein [Bryobacteraceae bacterium]